MGERGEKRRAQEEVKGKGLGNMKTPTHHGGCKTQMRVLLSTHTLQ